MKRCIPCIAVLLYACTGCTVTALDRHTVAQVGTAVDLRYREVVENLAQVADDPSTLPNFTSMYSGTIALQDEGETITTITWPISYLVAGGAGSIAPNPSFNRQVTQNWALDPTIVPEKLEAMRAALQWVAGGGPEAVFPNARSLLISPAEAAPGPDRHFNVVEKLAGLPAGWLGVGGRKDVPRCAVYKAHHGDRWVWVTPEGMAGLAAFTIIIEDIARVQINSPTLFNLPPQYAPIVLKTADPNPADGRMRVTASVTVDLSGRLYADPFLRLRIDNEGMFSDLRSIVTAAAVPVPALR